MLKYKITNTPSLLQPKVTQITGQALLIRSLAEVQIFSWPHRKLKSRTVWVWRHSKTST